MGSINIPGAGSGSWKPPVDTAGSLPLTNNKLGDARAAKDTGVVYVWTGSNWDTAVAGVGTVTSVDLTAPSILTVSGNPITGAGTIALTLADQAANQVLAGPTSGPNAAPTFRALDPSDLPTGVFNAFAGFDGSGVLGSINGFQVDTTSGGLTQYNQVQPNGGAGGPNVNTQTVDVDPIANSPNTQWGGRYLQMNVDPLNAGFDLGTAGGAIIVDNINLVHNGSSDTGGLILRQSNFQLGNGTDPITLNGVSYLHGFGSVAAGVTITGQVQGYGFQPSFNVASVLTNSIVGFFDFAQLPIAVPGYESMAASPTIDSIQNNSGYTGLNVNPTITTMTGNAGMTGVGIFGTIGTVNDGNYQGVIVNPTITLNKGYTVGLNVSVNNVTNYAGVVSSLVVQDITYTFNQPGDNNSYTIEYADTVTAGSETVTVLGQAITVNIESGVSTATQVLAACNANFGFIGAVSVVITGTPSNAQVSAAATNFAGGINPGTKKAANFDGDVQVNGALSFTGALNIGQLSSYATQPLVDGGGVPSSIDSLITAPTVANGVTVANADLLGVNTAMLLTIGSSATVTTSFLGVNALGLPAVVQMGAGSTIDQVGGAVFAISLDSGAAGGTIDKVSLCRSLALPNGTTTVNRLYGYEFALPFGTGLVTDHWGLYINEANANNYISGSMIIGGTAGSDDQVDNSSVALQIKSTTKAFMPSNMTTTERDALTPLTSMVVYNTTTNKLQVYSSGSWVDLH